MKVTLNISKLLEQGKITREEYQRLNYLAEQQTKIPLTNLLLGFSLFFICCLGLFMPPTSEGVILIGLALSLLAILMAKIKQRWGVLQTVIAFTGAMFLGGGIIWSLESSPLSFLIATFLLGLLGVYGKSRLLISLSLLTFSFTPIGEVPENLSDYWMILRDPLLAVTIYSLLTIILYQLSLRLKLSAEALAIAAGRTCVLLVNLGFWIGSLYGSGERDGVIPLALSPGWFTIIWIVSLVSAGIWASRANRPWLQNVLSIFAGIHLYTQWFVHFGISIFTVLPAGILAAIIGFLIWKYIQFKKLDIISKWF